MESGGVLGADGILTAGALSVFCSEILEDGASFGNGFPETENGFLN
jgi:hypothetical protein